jgi:hypothetical protein
MTRSSKPSNATFKQSMLVALLCDFSAKRRLADVPFDLVGGDVVSDPVPRRQPLRQTKDLSQRQLLHAPARTRFYIDKLVAEISW